jgi:beta-lactamase regulating signal transducer with metallopeptidase domain
MALDLAARLGIGVLLAWAALPLFARLARRSCAAPPAEYYRALVAALCLATMLLFLPLVRAWSSTPVSQQAILQPQPHTVTFVAQLVVASTARVPRRDQILAAIGGTWLLLLAAGLSVSITGRLRLRSAYRAAPLAPARARERAERIAAELGVRTPPIHVSDEASVAFTYGALTPRIVISQRSCELPDEALDFVLRHELCHVCAHDTRAMCLIDLAQRCFAGHPSLRALACEIRVAREARTDVAAAGTSTLEYAQFLLAMAEQARAGWERAPSGSLVSMADTALGRRVALLIDPPFARPRWRSWPALVVAGVTLGSLVFLTPVASGRPAIEHGEGLPNQVIRTTIHSYFPQLRACFDAVEGSASISLSFVIDRHGRALVGETLDESGAVTSTEAFARFAQCVDGVRSTMQFPVPDDDSVIVSYRMAFEHDPEPCDGN